MKDYFQCYEKGFLNILKFSCLFHNVILVNLLLNKKLAFAEIRIFQLYKEAKLQLARQPPFDVFDEIRNLR